MRARVLRSVALLFALVCGATAPATRNKRHLSGTAAPDRSRVHRLERNRWPCRQAWDAKQYDAAENFYKTALDRGGLSPAETIDAYVRLARPARDPQRTALARRAFRQAAAIDARFHVPPGSGAPRISSRDARTT